MLLEKVSKFPRNEGIPVGFMMLWSRTNWKKSFGIRKKPAAGICTYSSANSRDLLKCNAANSRGLAGTSQIAPEGFSQP